MREYFDKKEFPPGWVQEVQERLRTDPLFNDPNFGGTKEWVEETDDRIVFIRFKGPIPPEINLGDNPPGN